ITPKGDFFNTSSWLSTIEVIASSPDNDIDKVEIQVQKGLGTQYLGYSSSTPDLLVWLDDPDLWIETTLDTNNWYFDLPVSLLSDDNYFIRSRAIDLAGNIQNTTSTIDFIFDNTPPDQVTGLIIEEEATPLDLKLSWTEVNYNLAGVDYYQVDWSDNWNNNYTTSTQDTVHRTNYFFEVKAIDKAGNSSNQSSTLERSILLKSLVISEIQVADNEFVELYNPTNSDISLDGWYFAYYSSNQDWSDIPNRLKEFPSEEVIEAGSYYLIGVYGFSEQIVDWQVKTNEGQPYQVGQISNISGSVVIYSSNPTGKLSETLQKQYIDAIGWGSVDYVKETQSYTSAPPQGQSLERILNQDTDNNASDFEIQTNPNPVNSQGNWLSNWSKRKVLIIDNKLNSNDLTEYQIEINVSYMSGEMSSDFSDVRFTSSNGMTFLSYYRETYSEGVSAVFWVKVPSIPKYSEILIYQYYDNSAASYDGSGESVFVWFDDFDDANRISEYNTDKASWENGYVRLVNGGHPDYNGSGYISPILEQDIKNIYIKTKMLLDNVNTNYAYQGFINYRRIDDNNYWQFGNDNRTSYNYRGLHLEKVIDGAFNRLAYDTALSAKFNQWGAYEVWAYEGSHKTKFESLDQSFDHIKEWEFSSHYLNQEGKIYLRADNVEVGTSVRFDYLIVAKYTQPEPIVSVGYEEYSLISNETRSALELSDWGQRKMLTISNVTNTTSTAPLLDYSVKIELTYLTNMQQTDFSDVRFTDSDKQTVLSYWNESYVDETSAVFWVKVPSIPANGDKNIYLYYDNPSATYIGNGQDVFVWFDDFDTNRSSEYKFSAVAAWDTVNSQLMLTRNGYITPTNLEIKNTYIKTKMYLTSNGTNRHAEQGFIDYRYQNDDNNYWRFGLNQKSSYSNYGLNFSKYLSGAEILLNDYNQGYRLWNEWATYEIWTYNNDHQLRFLNPSWGEIIWPYTDVNNDINLAGSVYLRAGDQIDPGHNVIFDYLIIAKYKQPELTVSIE
ncbi:DUF2341 domain-containing protein, partial [Patescibacteria group bacterium]|nr:DUF2341 domain-containing protein [Patescibacteria group bacterium]